MNNSVEKIEHGGQIMAIIIRKQSFDELSVENPMQFVTPDEFPLQTGIQLRPRGNVVDTHFHLPFEKLENYPVQEFFHILSGKVQVQLFDDRENDAMIGQFLVYCGDYCILNTGHKIVFLEETKMLEIKQGPYRGRDKEKRFVK
jgi:hypothetical protein